MSDASLIFVIIVVVIQLAANDLVVSIHRH